MSIWINYISDSFILPPLFTAAQKIKRLNWKKFKKSRTLGDLKKKKLYAAVSKFDVSVGIIGNNWFEIRKIVSKGQII